MTIDQIRNDGFAEVKIVQACGAGAVDQTVTLPGRQARRLVIIGYAELVKANVPEPKPEAAERPRAKARGADVERRG